MSPAKMLADAVRAYVEEVHGHPGIAATVRIQLTQIHRETLDLDLSQSDLGETMTPLEEELLEFIEGLKPAEWLTATQIADRMPCNDNRRFRGRLSKLAHLELIRAGHRGYSNKKIEKSEKISAQKSLEK